MNVPPIDFPFTLIVGLCLAFGVGLAICVGRLLSHDTHTQVSMDWLLQLSSERYRPMLRLLSDDDIAFLRSQPGYRPSMASKLRAQRCQILKAYLKSLNQDFRSVCTAIRTLMVHSHQDRPDLARALFRYQLSFSVNMTMVRVRMIFYRGGLGSVDVSRLVKLFDLTRLELRSLAPSAMPASL